MMDIVKAVIYAARSKDEEEGKDSTGDQIAAIRWRLDQLGDRTVVGEPHVDHASGYRGNRGPGLEAAIATATQEAPSELWVFHSSRLARGSGEQDEARSLMELLVPLRRHGVTVRSVEDDAVLASPAFWGMAEMMSHKYSADLAAHVRRGQKAAFAKGRWHGGPVPDGYRLGAPDPDTGRRKLKDDPERAPIIRRIFELRDDGLALGTIARMLNAEGHRTRTGKPFTQVRIKDALANPIYSGRVVTNRHTANEAVAPGDWTPLIDPALFDRVREKAAMRTGRQKVMGRPPTRFALSGLATCDKCDRPMAGRRSRYVRKDGTRQQFYLCAGVKPGTCDAPRVDAARVDGAVVDQIHQLGIDFEAWERELTLSTEKARAAAEAEIGRHRKALEKLTRAVGKLESRLIDELGEDGAEDPALAGTLRRAVSERDEAQCRIDELQHLIEAEPDKDAMLDAHNALQRVLRDKTAPVNERLKRLFGEFRIRVVDDTVVILPVLLPDVIETHGGRPDTIAVLEGDRVNYMSHKQDTDTTATPVALVVRPPVKGLRVPLTESDTNACP